MQLRWFLGSFLSVVAAQSNDSFNYPKVVSMVVKPESLKEHHTDHFKIDAGAVLRRGQSFEVEIETDQDLKLDSMTVNFEVNREIEYNSAQFSATLLNNIGDKKYLVKVETESKAPVGKYEDIILYVQDRMTSENASLPDYEDFLYEYPFPLYLIFNPWNQLDTEVYIANETLRQEHILHEYGNVYCGSLNSYDSIKWHYGQSNQVTLDAAFHLLEKVNRTLAGNAIHVVQTMAHNQGMMHNHKTGGILVGTEDSLLEGNWGDFPFTNDTSPEIWTSTTDILNRWKKTGKPTKYGQCWVFAALQNALMRAIGVGSRQISAFGASIDMSKKDDPHHKNHHIIDQYFDKNGTTIYTRGQLWNFHSWNDIMIQRNVEKYSGWNSLDGTPPGLGPAPVRAIHDLDDDYPFNTSDVISSVHSTVRNYLVECEKTHKKLEGCKVQKQLKYDHQGLHLIVSTQTLPNGTLALKDITKEFIDPTADAYIPFKDDEKPSEKPIDPEHEDHLQFKIIPKTHGVVIGDNIEGVVEIKSNETETMDLNIAVTLETRTGNVIKKLSTTYQEIKLIAGEQQNITYKVDSESYIQSNLEDVYVRIVASGESKHFHFFEKEILDIDAPQIKMVAPKQTNKPFDVLASFTNPLPFKLENVCLTIHSHQLDFYKNKDDDITSETKCADLAPNGGTMFITSKFQAPPQDQEYYILSTVKGNYVPFTQAHVEVSKQKQIDEIHIDSMTLSSFE